MALSFKQQIDLAKRHGRAVADSHWKDFQEEKFRGPKFTWEHFPSLVGRMAYVSVYMSFPFEIKTWLKRVARQAGYDRARYLVKKNKPKEGSAVQ